MNAITSGSHKPISTLSPFRPESFDVIFSIGVLHHTPDTQAYFAKLVPLLKPGGVISIWVYPRHGDYITRAKWVRFVNRIPDRWFYGWCRWFVPWAESRLGNPLVGAIRRVFPFPTHGLGIEYDILDTFDGYSPRYHSIHSPEEVEGWFGEAGLTEIRRPSSWDTLRARAKAWVRVSTSGEEQPSPPEGVHALVVPCIRVVGRGKVHRAAPDREPSFAHCAYFIVKLGSRTQSRVVFE